jgi:CDP-6-deoxy-D-xylo-4-hexulose-3-dehydrase
LGFKLKFVDVNPDSLNMDIASVAAAINERTAGIFAVNLLGNPSELNVLRELSDKHDLFLLEDNCESMGAKIGDDFAGTFGDIGTFSTFFSHHISTMEGGVCLTDDEELAQIMMSLRAHGWTRELPEENLVWNKSGTPFDDLFRFVLPGYNLRPLEMSGAVGQEQLLKVDSFIAERRKNAEYFQSVMSDFTEVRVQKENGQSSWFGFSMVLLGSLKDRRAELVNVLADVGIESRPIVAGNFTRNPVIKHLSHIEFGGFPNADSIHDAGLFVGNHHFDLIKEIDIFVKTLREFVG